MGREENIIIFNDTEKLCETNEKLKESIDNSIKKQKLILETDKIPAPDLKSRPYFMEANLKL